MSAASTAARARKIVRSAHRRIAGAKEVFGPRRSLLIVPLALAAVLSAACAEDGPSVPNLPPIPTALPSGLPTALPTGGPTGVPSKAPSGDSQGDVVSAMGALLAPSTESVQSDAGPDAPCQNIV